MKEKLTFDEMLKAGVDKDALKKLESEYPEREIDLKYDTLRNVINKRVNPRLLIPLVAEEESQLYLDDIEISRKEWLAKELFAQKEFSDNPVVMEERQKHSLRMKSPWEKFASTGYSTDGAVWKEYQAALSTSMSEFDAMTQEQHLLYVSQAKDNRNLRINIEASIVADAAVGS